MISLCNNVLMIQIKRKQSPTTSTTFQAPTPVAPNRGHPRSLPRFHRVTTRNLGHVPPGVKLRNHGATLFLICTSCAGEAHQICFSGTLPQRLFLMRECHQGRIGHAPRKLRHNCVLTSSGCGSLGSVFCKGLTHHCYLRRSPPGIGANVFVKEGKSAIN